MIRTARDNKKPHIKITTPDGLVKSPYTALRCILRHCGVLEVRLIPQDLRALPMNFLRNRLFLVFLETADGKQ